MEELQHPGKRNEIKDAAKDFELETMVEDEGKLICDGLGSRWKFWRRRRYLVVIMIFLGEISKGLLRSNLSIAIFPMTENYTRADENGREIQVRDFDWDVKTRGFLLSVFFYGYIATNLPGGILAVEYGGAKLFGFGIFLTSAITLITPVVAHVHLYIFIAIRVVEGMCEGVLNPSAEMVLASWIPAGERSSSQAAACTGTQWGHVISIAASSAIGSLWGWQAIFYSTGVVGVVWFVTWLIIVKGNPQMDNRISPSELVFIENSTGRFWQRKSKMSSIPLFKMLTSGPVWALLIGNVAFSWSSVTYLTQTPAYIKDVLKVNYQSSGYISSVSFGLSMLTAYLASSIADVLTLKAVLSVTAARKIYICGSLVMMSMCGFLIQHMTSVTSVLVCLVCMQIFTTVGVIALPTNFLDIAPRYASVLGGITTTVFSLCGMVAPTVIGYLTQNKEWHAVFSIQSVICLAGALMYGLLGSGQLQTWADDRTRPLPIEDMDHIS